MRSFFLAFYDRWLSFLAMSDVPNIPPRKKYTNLAAAPSCRFCHRNARSSGSWRRQTKFCKLPFREKHSRRHSDEEGRGQFNFPRGVLTNILVRHTHGRRRGGGQEFVTAKIPFEFLASVLLRKRDTNGIKEEGKKNGFGVKCGKTPLDHQLIFFCLTR